MVQLAGEITGLLQEWRKGDPEPLNRVIVEVYDELKKAAAFQLAKEAPAHTLQPTALVNEAYLRLIANSQLKFPDRKCFFLFVGMLMRRILIDYARGKISKKRGENRKRVFWEIENVLPAKRWDPLRLMALDEGLERLKELDARKHEVMEMWLFLGLNTGEIGEILSRSAVTVRRELRAAKSWLGRILEKKHGVEFERFFT